MQVELFKSVLGQIFLKKSQNSEGENIKAFKWKDTKWRIFDLVFVHLVPICIVKKWHVVKNAPESAACSCFVKKSYLVKLFKEYMKNEIRFSLLRLLLQEKKKTTESFISVSENAACVHEILNEASPRDAEGRREREAGRGSTNTPEPTARDHREELLCDACSFDRLPPTPALHLQVVTRSGIVCI